MINQDQIIKLANRFQTTEETVLREYFQHIFLSYFYQQQQTNSIFFKGGTALRLVYKSPRFSEDLDFSSTLYGKNDIEEALITTIAGIEKENIPVSLEEAKTTTGGYLATILFQKNPSIAINLEISLRRGDKKGELSTINNDFITAYTIFALAQNQLIDEKLQALLARKKPRDFYDLYFMLRANLLTSQKKDLLPLALKTLNESDINFETELKQFLPKSHWLIIKDFKETLKRELQRFV